MVRLDHWKCPCLFSREVFTLWFSHCGPLDRKCVCFIVCMFSTADFEYGDVPYPMGGTHLKIEFVSLNEVSDYFPVPTIGSNIQAVHCLVIPSLMTCLNSQLPVSFGYRIFACCLHVDLSSAAFYWRVERICKLDCFDRDGYLFLNSVNNICTRSETIYSVY